MPYAHSALIPYDATCLPSGHEILTWKMTPAPATNTAMITIQLGPLPDSGRFAALLTLSFPNERTLTLPVTAKVVPSVTTDN